MLSLKGEKVKKKNFNQFIETVIDLLDLKHFSKLIKKNNYNWPNDEVY